MGVLAAAGIAAAGTVAAAGIGAAGSAGLFGGGGGAGAGAAGGIDAEAMQKLIERYQEMVDEGVDEYDDRLGGAITGYRSAVDTSLDEYTSGMSKTIKQFGKRQRAATQRYVKGANRIARDPMGQYVLPAVSKALEFNQQNTGTFGRIASELTGQDQQTRFKALDAAIPTWRETRDQAAEINKSLLAGEIPNDVKQQIARNSAFKATQGGFGAGSGAGRSLTARDLGRTSLDLTQMGQQNTMAWDDLLFRIAVPEQTKASDVMRFSGISSDTAANAGLSQMAARLGIASDAYRGNVATNTATLGANTTMFGNVLSTDVGASGNIFGSQASQAANIFGARTQTAENVTNFGSGLLTRQADDAQAAANFDAQQSTATANSIAAGIGGVSGSLADYYQNKSTVTKPKTPPGGTSFGAPNNGWN